MVISDKSFTIEEFQDYAAKHPDDLLELIDGRIVEKVTTEEHGAIAANIVAELRDWKRQNKVDGYYSLEATVQILSDDRNSRLPDVSFRLTEGSVSRESALASFPDFCVEIRSPSNNLRELRDKAEFYIANGARLVWLIYADKRLVEVYFEDGSVDIFTDENELSGGDVLPGFRLLVRDIFDV